MKKGTVLIALGIAVILSALGLTVYNLYTADRAYKDASDAFNKLQDIIPANDQIVLPIVKDEGEPKEDKNEGEIDNTPSTDASDGDLNGEQTQALPDYFLNPNVDMPSYRIDGFKYIGTLEIPDISVQLPIISRMSYSRLRKAPCRYSGSAYTDDMIIGAHCYENFFAQLKNVPRGGQVKVTDIDGNVFVYQVIAKESVIKSDVEGLKSGQWDLSLFTCPSVVNTDTRIVLRCERIYPVIKNQ